MTLSAARWAVANNLHYLTSFDYFVQDLADVRTELPHACAAHIDP